MLQSIASCSPTAQELPQKKEYHILISLVSWAASKKVITNEICSSLIVNACICLGSSTHCRTLSTLESKLDWAKLVVEWDTTREYQRCRLDREIEKFPEQSKGKHFHNSAKKPACLCPLPGIEPDVKGVLFFLLAQGNKDILLSKCCLIYKRYV